MKRWLSILLIGIVAILVGVWGYQTINDKQTYLSTDNATLAADTYNLIATQTGVLSDWSIATGKLVQNSDVVGRIKNQSITSGHSGTVIATSVYPKQIIWSGQTIAKIANLHDAYILAFIDEDQIDQVAVGQKVKVTIDSLPNDNLSGKVTSIGKRTGSIYTTSTPLPSSSASEKEVERVPVKIKVDGLTDSQVTLGVHAEVKIEK